MEEEYLRRSPLTGKKYNLFDCVRIVNITQATAYMSNDVWPVDIKISENADNGQKCLVFYFIKNETKELYDKWCKYELR